MLGTVLGFGGRIGRLRYFLLSLLITFAAMAMIFAIVFASASRGASISSASYAKDHAQALCLFVVGPFFLWFSLAVQAKRIRDIGWSPLIVILGWTTANIVDAMIARMGLLHPSSGGHGTALGAIVNLAMAGALLFWPGGEPDTHAPPSRRGDAPPLWPADPLLAIPVRRDPAAPVAFGRRGRV